MGGVRYIIEVISFRLFFFPFISMTFNKKLMETNQKKKDLNEIGCWILVE